MHLSFPFHIILNFSLLFGEVIIKQGYPHGKINKAIQAGKDRYWKEEKLTQNNKSVYSIIDQNVNVVEVEYRDFDNNLQKIEKLKVARSSQTSRTSPILGVCNNNTTPVQVRTSGENEKLRIKVITVFFIVQNRIMYA